MVRLSPDEVHIRDTPWIDTLLASPAQVSLIPKQTFSYTRKCSLEFIVTVQEWCYPANTINHYREDGINMSQQPTKQVAIKEVRVSQGSVLVKEQQPKS